MADDTRDIKYRVVARDESAPALFSLEKRLDGIKQRFGRRGVFGDLGEILKGGGIVGGVTFLVRSIGEAAERAGELARQFRAGAISAEEMQSQLLRGIPVLGDMTKMWDGILSSVDAVFDKKPGTLVDTLSGLVGMPAGAVAANEQQKFKEEKAQQDEIRQRQQDAKNRERARIQQEIDRVTRDAAERDRLSGKQGIEREVEQINIDRERRLAQADEAERNIPKLAPDRQDEARKRLAEARVSIEREADQKIIDARSELYAKFYEDLAQKEREQAERRRDDAIRIRREELRSLEGQKDAADDAFRDRTRVRQQLSTPILAGAQESRFGTGRADAFRERFGQDQRREQEKDAKETAKNTKKMADDIAKIAAAIAQQQTDVFDTVPRN